MHLRNALVNLALETATDTAIAEADVEQRIREQWMKNIHEDLQEILDDTGAGRDRHEIDLAMHPDGLYADLMVDGIPMRWQAVTDQPRGEWYAYGRHGVLRECPNPDCPWPDRQVICWFDDVDALAAIVTAESMPVHFGPEDSRRCDGITADPPAQPDVTPDPVVVLRERDCMTTKDPRTFTERLADLEQRRYVWTVCCDSCDHGLTVVAVHR